MCLYMGGRYILRKAEWSDAVQLPQKRVLFLVHRVALHTLIEKLELPTHKT